MDKSQKHAAGLAVRHLALISMMLILAACGEKIVVPQESADSCSIALSRISSDTLQPIAALDAQAPDNAVGGLLEDYVTVAAYASSCRVRYNGLVEYLRPVVEDAKALE